MKKKSLYLFFIVLGLAVLIFFEGNAVSNGNSKKSAVESTDNFIKRFYKDLESGNKSKVKKYFIKIGEEELKYLILTSKFYELERIESLETTTVSKKPLTVEVVVREWYKPGDIPYRDYLFILRRVDEHAWKIVELTMPGLP